jgi:hypothetical protein
MKMTSTKGTRTAMTTTMSSRTPTGPTTRLTCRLAACTRSPMAAASRQDRYCGRTLTGSDPSATATLHAATPIADRRGPR